MGLKQVTLQMEGSGQPAHAVELKPGTTVGEALVEVGLDPNETHMMAPGGVRLMDPTEDLYRVVDPGERLSVSLVMDAGDVVGMTALIASVFTLAIYLWRGDALFGIAADAKSSPSDRDAGARRQQPDSTGVAHLDRWLRRNGWEKRGSVLMGRFRTRFATFPARLEFADGGYQVYVKNPPDWMIRGAHAACWHRRPGGWAWLHQNTLMDNPIEAVRSMENFILAKSSENRRSA